MLTNTANYKKNSEMDKIDRRILHELQNNGRITMTELSQRVGLSKTPCLDRVRRLEKTGVICGYQAQINPSSLESGHIAFVQITLNDTTTQTLDEFNAAVKELPMIQACHMIAGGFDYLLKVRTNDIESYRKVLGDCIAKLPHLQQSSTFVVMETVIDNSTVSVQI